jgi:hypothetical protein
MQDNDSDFSVFYELRHAVDASTRQDLHNTLARQRGGNVDRFKGPSHVVHAGMLEPVLYPAHVLDGRKIAFHGEAEGACLRSLLANMTAHG